MKGYQNCSLPYGVLQFCTVISAIIGTVLTNELGPVSLGFSVFLHVFLNYGMFFVGLCLTLTLLVLNILFTLFPVLNMYMYRPLLHNTTSECQRLSTYT